MMYTGLAYGPTDVVEVAVGSCHRQPMDLVARVSARGDGALM